MGRVVGGLREAAKIPGLGKSKTILELQHLILILNWVMDVGKRLLLPIQLPVNIPCVCLH